MRQVEVRSRTLDQAKADALAQLGVTEDQAEIEVLEETKSFLGILGPQEVRIRVTVREDAPSTEPSAEPVAQVAGPASDSEPSVGRGLRPAPESEPEPVARVARPAADDAEEEPGALQPLAVAARDITRELLGHMGMEAQAEIAMVGDEEVTIEITGGDDIRLLIGKRGETLDAMQLLVAIVANRRVKLGGRVVLDAEHYRDRRRESLESMAHTQAARAKQTQKEVVIGDLKAYERRIIHLTLRDDPEVETYSEGDEHNRNLIISPKTEGPA